MGEPGIDTANAAVRARLLATIAAALEADSRVVAAWLTGSFGRGTADDLSDLDINLAVAGAEGEAIVADPESFVRTLVTPVIESNTPANAAPGGAFLLTICDADGSLQQVDWYLEPVATARRPRRSLLLFAHDPIPLADDPPAPNDADRERAIGRAVVDALAMIFITLKDTGRDDRWRAAGHLVQIDRILGRLDWLTRHGLEPDYKDPVRRFLPAALPASRAEEIGVLRALLAALDTHLGTTGRRETYASAVAAVSAALTRAGNQE